MAGPYNPGEDKAWELLAALKPGDVSRAASASYDPSSEQYCLPSYGMDFIVDVRNRMITSAAPGSDILLGKFGHFFKLTVLWYLVSAKDLPCTGRQVKPEQIRGGEIFTKGSHVLPLNIIADTFGRNREGFIEKGKSLGGEPVTYGDAGLRLSPLPRIPVILTLWLEDDEFPARADLLFDSTCDLQLPTDVLWSIAMLSAHVMA